ncbi:hypothetical protein DICPUDRAFT_149159 [Dictyostelium purpureum]|uniref:Uncharacterized protein n=1 Tax=Dictyostelium purpureum TaxID=5786 RepID=F0ZCZ9_DICPU|nr:uncharacterized protein DICPUDRAFT_149159 [Dictyostelium purpureum]EGC38180.1 hypothetical protein DICPUDRAFT_149159 [Dictyostelium purpureum]|eukprot:XP_003285307.1 hypothetical protein DICPUDRAFT_149159 [Dictyostelium purpureum]
MSSSPSSVSSPNKRINEFRKITTNDEFKEKRKEKQDIQRQKLKNQLILEKRQKLSTLNQNNTITPDSIKNELKDLYNKIVEIIKPT